MTRVVKFSVGATVALLVIGLAALVVLVQTVKTVGDLGITKTGETLTEPVAGECVWTINFEIENRTDQVVTIHNTRAAIQRASPVGGRIIEDETGPVDERLNPDEVTQVRLRFALNECLGSAADIEHDLLKVIYSYPGIGNRLETQAF